MTHKVSKYQLMTVTYPPLETPRLLLKPLQSVDIERIQRIFPRWEVVRFLSDRVPWPYPEDGAKDYVDGFALPQIEDGKMLVWTIRLKTDTETLIGAIELRLFSEVDNRGFWLAPEWQGHGYMTEAVEAVTEYWFEALGCGLLKTTNAVENIPSRRISERTGMRFAGHCTANMVAGTLSLENWEITRDEWLSYRDETKRKSLHRLSH